MHPNGPPPNRPHPRPSLIEEELSYTVVGGFFDVYNELGHGFSEVIYQRALVIALQNRGLRVEREVPVDVHFSGQLVGRHRLDLLVEARIILETKATDKLADATRRQVRNYLAAARLELGLILHFGPEASYHRILAPRTVFPARPIRMHPSNPDA